MYEMSFTTQIKSLLARRAVSTTELGELVGMSRSNLSATLAGKHDTRGSTLEALATGLDAEWLLVPKEHLLMVRRVLDGKGVGPDYGAKSAAELFLESLR
jgi:DNA-binding Xre family transcriptional regulator